MNEETLFHLALEKPPHERALFLDESCAGDAELRRRVEILMNAHDNPGSFLGQPVFEQAASASLKPEGLTHLFADAEPRRQENPDVTQAEPGQATGYDLSFLSASAKPGSIGRLGHYEVLEIIGKGGFGSVFKAFDEKLHRIVAIKVLAPEFAANGAARKRFIREAQAAAAVSHHHVVAIHNVEDEHQRPYIVMEMIDGVSLQDRLDKEGQLELKEILRIGLQIAEGLTAAHKQGLIHRDIKPANILLENGVQRVKITDFGLARTAAEASITQSGVIAGTPMYMAPEQAQGEHLDHRADLFSLGSVLYVLCTGRPPFRVANTMAVLKRVCEETPRPIREINPEVPDWLSDIVAKLHAKKPAERFQTAKEVADLLGQHLAHLQQPAHAPRPALVSAPAAAPSAPISQFWWMMSRFIMFGASFGLIIGIFSFFFGIIFLPGYCFEWWSGRAAFVLASAATVIVALVCAALDRHRHRWVSAVTLFVVLALTASVVAAVVYWPRDGGVVMPPEQKSPEVKKDEWVQLFNGKDLTGWKLTPNKPVRWKVENGILVGRADGYDHLVSERGDYANFHLLVEARIDADGDSGVYIRHPGGYEAQIGCGQNPWSHTGSLGNKEHNLPARKMLTKSDEWFTLEIIARGNHVTVKVNDEVTVDDAKLDNISVRGSIALQLLRQTVVQFRKIEIKELPPTKAAELAPPFVILARNAGAERKFVTLAEAVAAAQTGDTIEIRGDGPFVTEPVVIEGKTLTLRAGEGFRPVIRLSPAGLQAGARLLQTNAALTLEGLELQRVGDKPGGAETPAHVILASSKGAPLHVANCRFFLKTGLNAVTSYHGRTVEFRNCEFIGPEKGGVDWQHSEEGRLVMDNCVQVTSGGHGLRYGFFDFKELSVRLTRNTFVGKNNWVFFLGKSEIDPALRPIRLEAEENIFDALEEVFPVLDYRPKPGPKGPARSEGLIPRLLTWRGRHNLFPAAPILVKFPDAEQPARTVRTLAEWKDFWGSPETDSLQGRVRYSKGDLRTRAASAYEQIGPEDFRLAPGSPGKGAGPGGKDLGADVDLVGPGAAYAKWKQTPEYQEWRKNTGQPMSIDTPR